LLRVGVGKEKTRPFRAVRNQDVRIDPRWIWRTFVRNNDLFNNTRDIKLGFFMPTNGTADEKTRYVTIKDARIGKRARFWFPSVIFMSISNITSREGMKEARISKNARFWSSNAIFKNKMCDGKARVGKETHFKFFGVIFILIHNKRINEAFRETRIGRKTHFEFCNVLFIATRPKANGEPFGKARFDPFYFKYNEGAHFGHFHSQIRRYRISKLKRDFFSHPRPFIDH
jgi:hypothetical protein